MRFNTFDQVAEWYNSTKPLGGKDNKGLDIRPIGARRYKHERIKKCDEDTYALIDGYFDPDRNNSMTTYDEGQGYALDMTAILWSRRFGKEYIRIRNLPEGWVNFARAKFHRIHLPSTIQYLQHQSGKHEVSVLTPEGSVTYGLPKTKYMWDYNANTAGVDDGAFLEFRRDGDEWVRVSAPIRATSLRIDKELKKKLKPDIEAWYEQMQVLAPMLNAIVYDVRHTYATSLGEYLSTRKISCTPYHLAFLRGIRSSVAREILLDHEHEMRTALMALIAYRIGLYSVMVGNKDIKDMRSAYNSTMNKLLGLSKTEEI
jgi:hypothetical protein